MDIPRFEFRNFTPGPNLDQFANFNLEQIMRTAPYNATVDAVIELNAGGFQTVIQIKYGMDTFLANYSDPDVLTSLQRAFGKIRGDLSRWRRDRIMRAQQISRVGQGSLGPMLKRRKVGK